MPYKASRPCKHPACPRTTRARDGYCDAHRHFAKAQRQSRQREYDADRGSSAQRGYDAAWQKVRLIVKERDGWLCVCKRCKAMGRITPVTKTDPAHHVKPVATHPHLRLKIDNCETFSFRCHEVEEGRARDYEYESWLRNQQEGGTKIISANIPQTVVA